MTGNGESESLWAAGFEVVRAIRDRGHEAYLVGGCVRDRLLGRPLHDIDITTSALPDAVGAMFERTIPTGLKHGTVTVLHAGRPFEVTTYRTESGYSDARRPDRVDFVTDVREDLARRDFTINAMACGPDDEWVDPFGGKRDLEAGRIRCVGDAGARLGEDALRMLRAIRFAAEFNFRMTLSVWRGIRVQAPRLRNVAMERVGSEWDRMMAGADPDRANRMLQRSGLLAELKEPLPAALLDKRGGCRDGVRNPGTVREADVRWTAWLAGFGAGPEDAASLCRALRFSLKRETRIKAALAFDRRMAEAGFERRPFIRAVLAFGRAAAEDWLETRVRQEEFRIWLDGLKLTAVGELAVKGDELSRRLQKPPGPWVADMLRRLLEQAAFGRIANEKEELLREASDILSRSADF